jgi:putative endonuclease
MNFFVYLIINIKQKKPTTYVGYTSNLKNRLLLHNTSRGAKFTKGRKWTLIYKRCYKTKSLAMKEEYLLKKDRIKRKMIKKKFTDKLNYEYRI